MGMAIITSFGINIKMKCYISSDAMTGMTWLGILVEMHNPIEMSLNDCQFNYMRKYIPIRIVELTRLFMENTNWNISWFD